MKHKIAGMFGMCALVVSSMICGSHQYAFGNEKEAGWAINPSEKKTLYVAHWTHTPENCPGRTTDGAKVLGKFWEGKKMPRQKGLR